MASTIQLKTGTGSAVPANLTQGEVGINIDNGLVYYGSGSGNVTKQLESFTHITASGTISASGDVSASNIHLPAQGRVYFSDDQFITGQNHSVTIDGDDTVKIKADKHVEFKDGSNNTLAAINPNAGHVTASGIISSSTIIPTHITASGAISASGHVYGTRIYENGNQINTVYAPISGHTDITIVGELGEGNATAIVEAASTTSAGKVELATTAETTTGTATNLAVTPDGLRDHTFANINSTGIISASGIDLSNNVSSSGLYMPSSNPTNATTAVNSLLYVSSSTATTGSRTSNNLMYSSSILSAPLGAIHMKHGHFKLPNTSAANDMTYCSWGTGDRENTAVTNAYVSFFAPYSGRIRKFSVAANVGSFNDTQFHYLIANSLVAACSGNLASGNTLYDIDWGGSAVFDKGDELQIGVQSNTVAGNASLYWTAVFEFNVD